MLPCVSGLGWGVLFISASKRTRLVSTCTALCVLLSMCVNKICRNAKGRGGKALM